MKAKSTLIVALLLLAALLLSGCSAPGATATFEDYTGNAPNGTLGIVKLLMDNPDHKGLKVALTVTGFGNVPGVQDQNDAKKVTEALIPFASLKNEPAGYTGGQYYYIYYTDPFKAGSNWRVNLFYLVPPEAANEDLRFVFNDPDAKISYDVPCGVFGSEKKE